MPTLAARIKEAMGEMTPADLARAAKVSSAAVTFWLDGRTKSLKAEKAALLEVATGYRATWIVTGKGPKKVTEGSQPAKKGEVFQAPTDEEWVIFNNFRRLKDKDRQRLAAEIAELAEERQADIDEILARFGSQSAAGRAHARKAGATSEQISITPKNKPKKIDPDAPELPGMPSPDE